MGKFKVAIEPEFKDILSTLSPEQQTEVMKGIIYYPDYFVEDSKAWTIIKYMLDKQLKKHTDRSNKARAAVTKRWSDFKALKLGKATTTPDTTIATPSTIENKARTEEVEEKPIQEPKEETKVVVTFPKHELKQSKEEVISEWKKIEYAGDRLLEESRDMFQIEMFIKKIDKWVELHKAYPLIEYDILPDITLTKGNLTYLLISLREGETVPLKKIYS